MKIAIDAMGGDFAPEEIIKGAILGAREYGVGVILVGPRERIQAELAKVDASGLDIEIVHTDEYLVEGEHPAYAMRKKRNASIMVATKLVREGRGGEGGGGGWRRANRWRICLGPAGAGHARRPGPAGSWRAVPRLCPRDHYD